MVVAIESSGRTTRRITWVIKFSKYCNFRCTYCYEMPWLHDRSRIHPSYFETLFRKIHQISTHFAATPKVCWHGGEPLLLPKRYLSTVSEACDNILVGFPERVLHTIQTNLSILTEWHLEFLRNRFNTVGVSFDPFGDCRVDVCGNTQDEKVLHNAERLLQAGIHFGCISVLSRRTVNFLSSTFGFFNDAALNFRILPYYRTSSTTQTDQHGLTEAKVVSALKSIFDLWLVHGRGITIEPIDQYLHVAIASLTGRATLRYDKSDRERVLIVNTDGELFSVAETYNAQYSYGNIFTDNVEKLLTGPGRQRAIADSMSRMKSMCTGCSQIRTCSGWYAAEATLIERQTKASHFGCGVPQKTIEYIASELSRLNLIDVTENRIGKTTNSESAIEGDFA